MKPLHLLAWLAIAAIGAVVVAVAWPRVCPHLPDEWSVNKEEATTIALEAARDLGDPVDDPYVVTRISVDEELDLLLRDGGDGGEGPSVSDGLVERVATWEVTVYRRDATPHDWTYRAEVALDGTLFGLRHQVPDDEEGGAVARGRARERASTFLSEHGVDLDRYEAPTVRVQDLESRTDTVLRYRRRSRALGEDVAFGVDVHFAGERLVGFSDFVDDPGSDALAAELRPLIFFEFLHIYAVLLVVPFVAVPFVRRYHAGEVGVKRGGQILFVVLGLGALFMIMTAKPYSEGWNFGSIMARWQVTYWTFFQMTFFFFLPAGLLAFLSWSVGESIARERWPQKLAAFDALLRGAVDTLTLARSSLRGVAIGLLLAAVGIGGLAALRSVDLATVMTFGGNTWAHNAAWPGLAWGMFALAMIVYTELFGRLLLVSAAVRRWGRTVGILVASIVGGLVLWGPWPTPIESGWAAVSLVGGAAALAAIFLRFDLLTTIVAHLTAGAAINAYPFLVADDAFLQLQGCLMWALPLLPFVLSARALASDREFEYRWEDVPPHVRRIAERERQKVELETAREIQTSILPKLPPELNGVELAHAYEPATEVGGDFYDVLALDDGRLAVAVGDVSGHGVSSGLVMSMVKSALAVQTTFDPEVEAVFARLNRIVYQSARRRLLTTLTYALVDPRERLLTYASAGHIFPYRVTGGGRVYELEAGEYPLGVRRRLRPRVRSERLEPGDSVVLLSDGVVEATPEDSDEQYGYERLEKSLERNAGLGPQSFARGVMVDLETHTGRRPRTDDVTLLVVRLPKSA